MESEQVGGPPSRALVLAEDKRYYPSAEEVFGAGVEALVMDEDAQALEEPIIPKAGVRRFDVLERDALPCKTASPEFLGTLLATPGLVRSLAVVGHLHHGKTSLVDTLLAASHDTRHVTRLGDGSADKQLRYTDSRQDEQERGMSIKAQPLTLVLPGSSGKSFCLQVMDAPGHVAFSDELCCSLRYSDAALLVVDAVEGCCFATERAIQAAAAEGTPLVVFINKLDRLILELKMPPADAFYKLRHVLEELNAVLAACWPGHPPLDPTRGNVAFGSALYGWAFTLHSVAALYADVHGLSGPDFDVRAFAARLWGDWYVNPSTRAISRKQPPGGAPRTCVQYILEPLWKVHAAVVGEEPGSVAATVAPLGISLTPKQLKQDVKPLLATVCGALFGDTSCLVDMLVGHCPSFPAAGGAAKVAACYSGPHNGAVAAAISAADPKAPLRAYVSKMVPAASAGGKAAQPGASGAASFDALVRIMCGTLHIGDKLRVLGEAYTPDDEEDSDLATVTGLAILQARFRLAVDVAFPGQWVLVSGIDHPISKSATLVPASAGAAGQEWGEPAVFAPPRYNTSSVVKVAAEPLRPSDLPRLVAGLRAVSKSYPLAVTSVEESGEHTICGTSEVYLDCVLRDLREQFADVEIKVADPTVRFCETCVETSGLKCFAETPNKANKLTFIAEPLDARLADDLEKGRISLRTCTAAQVAQTLRDSYGWDALASRSLWAIGPEDSVAASSSGRGGTCCLLDDTLPGDVDKAVLAAVRSSITAGFQWACREGPLCDEPIRRTAFKLLDATLGDTPLSRGAGQVIPTARRACYSALLTASPRLMEPLFRVDLHCPADAMSAVYAVLARRRGHVVIDRPVPGTPVYTVRCVLPALESFGFETDIRTASLGTAFGMAAFDSWAVMPGDPLDRSVVLRPLEPSPASALARECMLKTRRRKGLAEDVSVMRYLDDPELVALCKSDPELARLL